MRVDNQQTSTKKNNKKDSGVKPTIHIVHILDRSGSMNGGKLNNAIKGINTEIEELKKDDNINYLFSMVHFGSDIKTLHWQVPIHKVGEISVGCGGMTALYQAIGETLDKFPQIHPVLVKVFTDGAENASIGNYSSAFAVKQLINNLEQKDFTITFVGTEQDVKNIQANLNIAEGNTLVHDNTPLGIERSFRKSMVATQAYSASVSRGEYTKTFDFYNQNS